MAGSGDLQQLDAVIDLQRGVLEPEAVAQQLRHLAASLVTVGTRQPTSTCADSAGKPLVISHTCRSCTSTTPVWATSASPIACGSRPSGAASRKIRPEAFTSA